MAKGKCTLCGCDHYHDSYALNKNYIIFCDDCLNNWTSNKRSGIYGRLQIGNKKEEIIQKAD